MLFSQEKLKFEECRYQLWEVEQRAPTLVEHHTFFCSMCIILCELVVEEKGKNVLKCSATSGRLETGYTLVVRKGYFSPLFFSPQFRVV